MNEFDSSTRIGYLQEMGLTVWVGNGRPLADGQPVVGKPDGQLAADSWEAIKEQIDQCEGCGLCQRRNRVVPGVGDREADWLFVGEGPGREEDRQGEPFVGRSGRLLDFMMRAMRIRRGENVYIANIVKCRASDDDGMDRAPSEEEVNACFPYLVRQISLVRPKIMVALGKTAAVSLLKAPRDVSLASLRNKTHFFECDGMKIPLVITYHPSYLLRSPKAKKQAWQDLCQAMDILGGAANTAG